MDKDEEYERFKLKIAKLSKELYDAVNQLDADNQKRFFNDLAKNLPMACLNLANLINNKGI